MLKTTFLIPSIRRDTLDRAIKSCAPHLVLTSFDDKRQGAGITRNELISLAKTKWVSFLDDDDTVTSDYVERLETEIADNPEADVIYFRSYWADNGMLLPTWPTVGWGIGINFSVKRDVTLEHPFRSEANEDLRFIERLQEAGKQIHFSKYLTYRVRH